MVILDSFTKEINPNSIVNADCLDVMKYIKSNSIDMVLCDLPYGSTACKWDIILPFEELWKEYYRICKENSAMVFTASQPFTTLLIQSNIKDFRYEWIWEKPQGTNPMNAKYMPLKSHENILIFYQKRPTYNPQMWKSTPYSGFKSKDKKIGEIYGSLKSQHRDNPEGLRYPKTVLRFSQEKGLHPTQKPLEMMRYLIRTYSNEGETILDNTMGSGTTGLACIIENRKFIGIEKDEKYFEIAKERINT